MRTALRNVFIHYPSSRTLDVLRSLGFAREATARVADRTGLLGAMPPSRSGHWASNISTSAAMSACGKWPNDGMG